MISSFDGKTPKIAPSAFISDMACIIGDVEIGENSSIWPGAVVRGDMGSIVIGDNTQIEDNAVIHSRVQIGSNVVIGHCAVVEALKIGDYVLIGNGAIILDRAEIGNYCIVGAGALIREEVKIPDRSLAAGVPAKIMGEVNAEREAKLKWFLYSREFVDKHKAEGTV